jgi:hypothetical protein
MLSSFASTVLCPSSMIFTRTISIALLPRSYSMRRRLVNPMGSLCPLHSVCVDYLCCDALFRFVPRSDIRCFAAIAVANLIAPKIRQSKQFEAFGVTSSHHAHIS